MQVIDQHGLLSGNPALWPEELKQAIARCCCGDEGSSSSSESSVDNPCCKNQKLPTTLGGNIRNTKVHDTGLSLLHRPKWIEKGPYWPPFQTLDPWLNSGYVEGHPPGIPLEGVLGARESLIGPGFLVSTEGGAAWWSDLYEDFSSSHELDGVFWVKLNPLFGAWLPINYHISMTIQNYFYVVVNQEYWSTFPTVGYQPTCNMSLVQLSYPVGRVTYTGIPVGGFGYPAETSIDWTVGNAMSSFNLIGGYRQRSSIMLSYTGGVNDETGCSGFYQLNYKGLKCLPYERIHVFEGANGGPPVDPPLPIGRRQILSRQPAIQAVVVPQPNPNSGQIAGGSPGWQLVSPLTDGDYENYRLLNPPSMCPFVINPNPEPHMEAFE